MMRLIGLMLALMVSMAAAQCADFPDDLEDNVCRFDQDSILVGTGAETCATVNNAPFATLTQQCRALMLEDGKECSYAIARYFCSARCPDCQGAMKPACENLCEDASTRCPKMWAGQCQVANTCTESSTCTSTGVNKDKVDDLTGLGDGDDGNSASSMSVSFILLSLLLAFVIQ